MAKRGTKAKSPARRSVWRRGLVLAASTLASGLCMLMLTARDWPTAPETVRLSRLSDAELEPRLRELVRQGPDELMRVVESLAAKSAHLRSAADRTLHEEIEHCAKSSSDAAAIQLDRIARALARRAAQLDGDGMARAAAIADRILAIGHPTQGSERLQNCHVVLKEDAERRMKEQARLPAGKSAASNGHDSSPGSESKSRSDIAIVSPLAGGGLAAAPSDARPRRLPNQAASRAKRLVSSQAQPLDWPVNSPSNPPSATEAARSVVRASDESIPSAKDFKEAASPEPSIFQTTNADAAPSTAAQTAALMPRDLTRLLELADRIHFSDAPQSAATRAELEWLGIDQSQLKLARGAVDHDPQIRREVVDALASVETVDTRGWLLWLSHDRDAEVRRAAISLLATASDPELRKRVRQAADSDSDPRIREQARAALTPGDVRR